MSDSTYWQGLFHFSDNDHPLAARDLDDPFDRPALAGIDVKDVDRSPNLVDGPR